MPDDAFDGDFFDVYVAHREFVQQRVADVNRAVAFDLELDAAMRVLHELAVFCSYPLRLRFSAVQNPVQLS